MDMLQRCPATETDATPYDTHGGAPEASLMASLSLLLLLDDSQLGGEASTPAASCMRHTFLDTLFQVE